MEILCVTHTTQHFQTFHLHSLYVQQISCATKVSECRGLKNSQQSTTQWTVRRSRRTQYYGMLIASNETPLVQLSTVFVQYWLLDISCPITHL